MGDFLNRLASASADAMWKQSDVDALGFCNSSFRLIKSFESIVSSLEPDVGLEFRQELINPHIWEQKCVRDAAQRSDDEEPFFFCVDRSARTFEGFDGFIGVDSNDETVAIL